MNFGTRRHELMEDDDIPQTSLSEEMERLSLSSKQRNFNIQPKRNIHHTSIFRQHLSPPSLLPHQEQAHSSNFVAIQPQPQPNFDNGLSFPSRDYDGSQNVYNDFFQPPNYQTPPRSFSSPSSLTSPPPSQQPQQPPHISSSSLYSKPSGRSIIEPNDPILKRCCTVFGFPNNKTGEVLQIFGKYGEIVDSWKGNEGNWINFCYRTIFQCESALSKDGMIFTFSNGEQVMIGVQKTKPSMYPSKDKRRRDKIFSQKEKEEEDDREKEIKRKNLLEEYDDDYDFDDEPRGPSSVLNKFLDYFLSY